MSITKKKASKTDSRRVGSVRPSQLMHTYGVGSIVDLPNFSVVVSGLERWADTNEPVTERRLLNAIQGLLGTQVKELRAAPLLPETSNPFEEWARTGVAVQPFPRWLRCTRCNLLSSIDTGLFKYEGNAYAPHRARWFHDGCGGNKRPTALPARFALACPAGHLDEVDWVGFCHRDVPVCSSPVLQVKDTGLAARSTDQRVECRTCGAGTGMTLLFGFGRERILPRCRGRHPHLALFETRPCPHQAVPLVVGSTNQWFGVSRSVLSIPDGASALEAAVLDLWALIGEIESVDKLEMACKFNPDIDKRLKDFEPGDVVAAITRLAADETEPDADPDLLGPEWHVFTGPERNEDDLRTRHVGRPAGIVGLGGTVAVDRLREVSAMAGFTRIDSLGEADAGELRVRMAPLVVGGRPSWVPAAESRGEGLLVTFDEDAVQAWEERATDHDQLIDIRGAHAAWWYRRNLSPLPGQPGSRFVLLHSFAHMLIQQVALECGYSTASIKERIYSRSAVSGDPMAGVLVYTAAPDSEGTLGGLVSLAHPDELGRIVTEALRRATLCSTDPFCSEHRPDIDQGTSLHAAACHSCLFLPETSCEHGNRALDRSAIVPTFAVRDLAFFSVP